ncbi:MAG: hypothetical protein OEM85_16450 [Gammaproteobacteria bacterium]|nr:hypothetical protein [Gammaproteobacteria bacterium]
MARRIIAGLLCLWLAGCEIDVSYRASLPGLSKEGNYSVVRGDGFDLYLAPSPSTDAPAITVIAAATDRPAVPWDWDDFQSWPADQQERVYGEYYESLYFAPSVTSSDACPILSEEFDHRDSALERDYGAWLRPGLERPFDDAGKGLIVEIPLDVCNRTGESKTSSPETLVVVVRNRDGEALDTIEVAFNIDEYDRYVDWLF